MSRTIASIVGIVGFSATLYAAQELIGPPHMKLIVLYAAFCALLAPAVAVRSS